MLYGKKGEELLWRKGYYDIVSTAKKLKKKVYSQDDISNIQTHINAGVGFYHHLIAKIQCEFQLNLNNLVDFSIVEIDGGDEHSTEIAEWATSAVHQSLIYLGDLNRYKLEILPETEPNQAFRYYLQAIAFKCDQGMPHNQMGTLAMNQNRFLDSVYHYMRCLACPNAFEGTTNNLHSLFEKNNKFLELQPDVNPESESDKNCHLKNFISRFLLLIDIWYFNKKVPKVYNLCHQTYKDLEECLSQATTIQNHCESPLESESSSESQPAEHLTNDMIFKMVVICLLSISKLQKTNPQSASTIVAFTLAIYSQLLLNANNHFQESILNYPIPDFEVKIEQNGIVKDLLTKNKRSTSKLRRRKVLKVEEGSESSASEAEDSNISSDDESFQSDVEDDLLAESSDEEADVKNDKEEENQSEEKVDVIKKLKRMDVNVMLEIVTEERSLQAIKIINDWLMQESDIIKSCGTSTRTLLSQITNILNLININIKSTKLTGVALNINSVIKNEDKIPLSEDVVLKGVDILAKTQKNIDWNYWQKRGMNVKEESAVRIVKFLAFGKFLTNIEETGITFDEHNNVFVCKDQENDETKNTTALVEELVSRGLNNIRC